MGFFYRHNPKKYNYIPRYYDPDKEAWEQKKAEFWVENLEAFNFFCTFAPTKLTNHHELKLKLMKNTSGITLQ